ncbi:MAG: Dabb family protein [Oscillospiraceae bacterium]|nr:Dabb family protein [Oscillospiraceae bacterium]
MIKHIVMFKFQAEANGKTAMENAVEAKLRAEQLPAQIPQLKKLEVRLNHADADPTNYEFALICDFENMDDLNAYQTHPAHVAFGQFIKPLREARACIDYEM